MLSRFSHFWLFVILWVACQAPLSMGFPKQEYWSRFPLPLPEDLPNSGIEPESHCYMTYDCIFRGFQTVSWFLVKWKLLSCVWLCDPMVYRVQGILQARILKWIAFPFSKASSQPRDQTQVSLIAGEFLTSWATREALWFLESEVKSLSCVQLFEDCSLPDSPSIGFSGQEYWNGLPFPSPGDLPNPGIEARSPALQQTLYCLSHQECPVPPVLTSLPPTGPEWPPSHLSLQDLSLSLISSPPFSPSSSGKMVLRPHVLAVVNQLGDS